jgi:hypothetical protein
VNEKKIIAAATTTEAAAVMILREQNKYLISLFTFHSHFIHANTHNNGKIYIISFVAENTNIKNCFLASYFINFSLSLTQKINSSSLEHVTF